MTLTFINGEIFLAQGGGLLRALPFSVYYFLMDVSELKNYLEMKFVFMRTSFGRMKDKSLCLGSVLLGCGMES